jgi:hypothetical protein
MRQTRIPPRFAARVLFQPVTGFYTPCFPFSPYLVFHALTIAPALLHVRIVFAPFEWFIVTALLPTTWDRLPLGL